jgi:type I restriction enzyme S subunit
LYFVTPQKAEQLARFDVNVGDLLFARSGATLGKVCVAPDFVHDWRMTGHILRVRLSPEFANPAYASFALRGNPTVVAQVFEQVRGVTRPGYNTELLESIDLPLPPISEQEEIVRRVNALFAVADQIETALSTAARRAQAAPQAILAKAFRGELLPTEAELARTQNRPYETATQLLARISKGTDRDPQPRSNPKARERTRQTR